MTPVQSHNMNRSILLVAIGGLAGSVCRFITASYFTKLIPSDFPYGTFIANVAGCLLIGLFYGMSERFAWFSPGWRLMLATGFCGGFTTFSSFSYENIKLLQAADYRTFGIYTLGSLFAGLSAAFIGIILTKI